jgi:hypothetical protein
MFMPVTASQFAVVDKLTTASALAGPAEHKAQKTENAKHMRHLERPLPANRRSEIQTW